MCYAAGAASAAKRIGMLVVMEAEISRLQTNGNFGREPPLIKQGGRPLHRPRQSNRCF
jgi:hypothetical protein